MPRTTVMALCCLALAVGGPGRAALAQASQIPPGHYICFHFTTPLPLLNFDIKGGGRYVDAEGKSGSYRDDGPGLIVFSGGNFDGQRARFRREGGKTPTIGFQGTGGRETEICQPGR